MRALTRAFAFLLVAFAASAVVLVHAQSFAVHTTVQAPQAVPRPTDAQGPGAPAPTGTTFRTTAELVALNVTVTDSRQQYVTGLTKDDFAVFEDGVPQEITFFATTNVPLDLTIMIDTSASMTDKIDFVHQAATNFVHTLRPSDRAEIVGFSDHQQVLAPLTSDVPALERAIQSTFPHGSTALYTSLYIAVEDVSRLARQQQDVRRQAIVVLTDGEDTASMLSFEDLMDAAKRSAVAIYAIRITSPFDPRRMDESVARFSTESDFALRSLATETGARSFFPFDLKDLNGVYGQIAEELSSQYSIGYMPRVHRDEAFHRLFVRVLHRVDARPRTRSGYYSSRPLPASLIGGQQP